MRKFSVGDDVRVYGSATFPIAKGKVTQIRDKLIDVELSDKDIHIFNTEDVIKDYTHLSPTGLALFERDVDEFYMKYLSRTPPPPVVQTQPMSVGSAFDAYVKNYIVKALNISKGYQYPDDFEFETLFKKQVEEHNREWARENGHKVFEAYKASGALASLMLELCAGDKAPRFEFQMQGLIKKDDLSVPITGIPDLGFHNHLGAHVITDWKVNGYCSSYKQSPKPFYVMCRDSWSGHNSRNNNQPHKDAMVTLHKGINIDIAHYMETIDVSWAAQLATYGWLLGEPVGSGFIVGIEQLSCSPGPMIRVANFRNRVSEKFQFQLFERYKNAWARIISAPEGFFPEMSPTESRARCELLEKQAVALHPTGDDKEDWFNNVTRSR